MDETSFVEQYWTNNWIDHGGVEQRAHRLAGRFDWFLLKAEWRIMRRQLKQLGSNLLILDGGCGAGEWCCYLSSQGHRVIGVDISKPTVAKLQEIFPEDAFLVGDIRDLEFGNDSIDA
ncbi:MAG: class I SAM-dependent methyltransferase [Rhodospirillales bacterium]|nr:class I SAM-dependent methyltransferase [Rhodospirillales bacterium]